MPSTPVASSDAQALDVYRRRRPETSVLYRLVGEHLETFLDLARQGSDDIDPVPGFVERTIRKYLECGILAHGFARAFCPACGQAMKILAFVTEAASVRRILAHVGEAVTPPPLAPH